MPQRLLSLFRALRARFGRRRAVADEGRPDTDAVRAARQRHAIRVRDETLARVTFGQG